MKGTFRKAIMLSTICSIGFYSGAQFIGQTEASFSSQTTLEPIEISAAVVFPAAVQDLIDQAQNIFTDMIKAKSRMPTVPEKANLEELNKARSAVIGVEQELQSLLLDFENVHTELANINKQVKKLDPHTYRFVQTGFLQVDKVRMEIKKTIDFPYIKHTRLSIELRIKKLEEMEKEKQSMKQAKPEKTDDGVVPQAEPTETIDQNEGKTADEEKSMESSS
ncbi:hypothetical protein [Fictibacillus barbaricus]|uniref:DUF4047 domain-containing protein n=1 Tax=Fictibacillus barbaricus TaxID=182136 RepID=A0ABS2ZAL4_9BACL|nr:hypothetical protein [Fictibacillus barbaricus]MBN3544374.1 hypothetical protein [Fictibacillus barbaricus]GGB67338.1 hypothetical protein GCM10007199_36900 [Fictibacillus barbaricus]